MKLKLIIAGLVALGMGQITAQTPCRLIHNGGFETGMFDPWVIQESNPAPFVSNLNVHSGAFAAHVGSLPLAAGTVGNSSFSQDITLPADGGTISLWFWKRTSDTIANDSQDALILDSAGNVLRVLFHTCDNTQQWTQLLSFLPFGGQTLTVKFSVHDNGGAPTDMFIDDVAISAACRESPTPRPDPTPRPRP